MFAIHHDIKKNRAVEFAVEQLVSQCHFTVLTKITNPAGIHIQTTGAGTDHHRDQQQRDGGQAPAGCQTFGQPRQTAPQQPCFGMHAQ